MPRQRNILLIEDDARVRQALGQALAVENYRVVPAANENEALREFDSSEIDIILLDLNPRNGSAWNTVQRLTALRPQLRVVGMSARLEQNDSNLHHPAFDALMEKPLDLLLLVRTLNELTSQHRFYEP